MYIIIKHKHNFLKRKEKCRISLFDEPKKIILASRNLLVKFERVREIETRQGRPFYTRPLLQFGGEMGNE